jgi:hypothetical protein
MTLILTWIESLHQTRYGTNSETHEAASPSSVTGLPGPSSFRAEADQPPAPGGGIDREGTPGSTRSIDLSLFLAAMREPET